MDTNLSMDENDLKEGWVVAPVNDSQDLCELVANRSKEKGLTARRTVIQSPVGHASMMFDHPSSLTLSSQTAIQFSKSPEYLSLPRDEISASKTGGLAESAETTSLVSADVPRRMNLKAKKDWLRSAKRKASVTTPSQSAWNCGTLCLAGATGYGAVQHSVSSGMAGSRPFSWRRGITAASLPADSAGLTAQGRSVQVLDLRNLPEGDYYFSSAHNRLYDCSAFSAMPTSCALHTTAHRPSNGDSKGEMAVDGGSGHSKSVPSCAGGRTDGTNGITKLRRGIDAPPIAWNSVNPRLFSFPQGRALAESGRARMQRSAVVAASDLLETSLSAPKQGAQGHRPSSVNSATPHLARVPACVRGLNLAPRPATSMSLMTAPSDSAAAVSRNADKVQLIPKDFYPRSLPAANSASSSFPARPERAGGTRQRRRPPSALGGLLQAPETPASVVGGPSPWPISSDDGFYT